MALLGELKVRISPDNLNAVTKDIKKKFKQTGKDIEKSMDDGVTKWAKKTNKAFENLKSTIASVFAVGAILAFGKRLLQLGSDATEFESKFKTVFKGVEEEAFATFNSMSQAVGRSNLDLIRFAGTVGDTLKPMGLASDQALALSENMIKLAIDTASFNNVSDEQAINAFTKALTGEREALKSLGIVINETDVKQKAYELGLASTGQELTKSAKALATWQLLLDNTADAQGDAVRTMGSFANQLKRVQGIIKDTFSQAGKEIASESATTLKTIGDFVQIYGEAIFGLLVEIGRSIGDFFKSIGSAIWSVFDAIGVDLSQWEGRMQTFGNVLLIVLHGLNVGIRTFGILIGGIAKLIVAEVQDWIKIFQDAGKLIATTWSFLGDAITTIFQGIGNNIVANIQSAINGVIDHVNGLVQKLEDLVGIDLFGEIANVGQRDIIAFGQEVSNMYDNLKAENASFWQEFGDNTRRVLEGIKDDFLDLWVYSIQQMDKIGEQTVEGARKAGEEYDTSFASAKDLMAQFGDLWALAWDKTAKGAKWAKQAVKDLEKEIKDAESAMDDLAKKSEKAKKAEEKFVEAQKKYFADLKKEIQDVNEELRINAESFGQDRADDTRSFARSEIETQVELEEQIAEKKKQINKEQAEEEQNVERINELKQELVDLEREYLDVKSNIANLDQWDAGNIEQLLEEERARAQLSDAKRRELDFQAEQEAQQKAFEQEQQALEKRRNILELFQSYQFNSIEQLEALKAEKRLEELSVEEQQLIQQLANERIEFLLLRDDKIRMEKELADATIALQARVYNIASQNIASLDAQYTSLISRINQAISAQQRLNALRASQRYKGWPVSAWQPYLVWENPDWSINERTTELFVPNVSGSIVPAGQVQQALKQISNVNNSRKAEISWPIYVNKEMDFELLMERAFFRS